MSIAQVLLAAGRSRRFGPDDKLEASLGGLSLLQHVARTLRLVEVDRRYIVSASAQQACDGFTTIHNAYPETGLGRSIALGVAQAKRDGASAVLLALADMPFLSVDHFSRLLALYGGRSSIVATSDGKTRMPPAIFGSDWFEDLQLIAGDVGARALLRQALIVTAPANELLDIDCHGDLERARRLTAPAPFYECEMEIGCTRSSEAPRR